MKKSFKEQKEHIKNSMKYNTDIFYIIPKNWKMTLVMV
jgi:hypothetical protein